MDPDSTRVRIVASHGFPAHAGMDPYRWIIPIGGVGFPRPRGDGPPSLLDDSAIRDGFPAHAGMDPSTPAGRCRRVVWFPRPRGDGPHDGRRDAPAASRTVSPPTRGWTLRHMNTAALHGLRFPRPRGDGPHVSRHVSRRVLGVSPPTRGWTTLGHCRTGCRLRVSPPTRGWTLQMHIDRRDRTRSGFPAHAGMDLLSKPADGTLRWHRPGCGFPAHAGMDLLDMRLWSLSRVAAVSPPTRGWTALRDRARFPRPRGDGPQRGPRPGFPRPRGDGPLPGCQPGSLMIVGFPAHAGMDHGQPPVRRVEDRGFPAHAGMDLISYMAKRGKDRVSPPTRGWTG